MPSFIPEFSDAPVFVLFLNADQTVGYINDWGCQLTGFSREEIMGKRWIEQFVVHENSAAIQLFYERIMAGEVELIENFENHIRSKDGQAHLISWHSKLVRDGGGKIIGLLTFGEDYTDRKTLLKALNKQDFVGAPLPEKYGEEAAFIRKEAIAFELHDNINQVLTTCKLLLEQELVTNPQLPLVQRSSQLLGTVITDIRNLSHRLNALPVHFTDFELSLRDFLDGVMLASGLHFVVEVDDNEQLNRTPAHVLSSIYRVVQEHTSQIIRHARATTVHLRIAATGSHIALQMADDGQGFELPGYQQGSGPGAMLHRINLNRGSLYFSPAPEGGNVLKVDIPLG